MQEEAKAPERRNVGGRPKKGILAIPQRSQKVHKSKYLVEWLVVDEGGAQVAVPSGKENAKRKNAMMLERGRQFLEEQIEKWRSNPEPIAPSQVERILTSMRQLCAAVDEAHGENTAKPAGASGATTLNINVAGAGVAGIDLTQAPLPVDVVEVRDDEVEEDAEDGE